MLMAVAVHNIWVDVLHLVFIVRFGILVMSSCLVVLDIHPRTLLRLVNSSVLSLSKQSMSASVQWGVATNAAVLLVRPCCVVHARATSVLLICKFQRNRSLLWLLARSAIC